MNTRRFRGQYNRLRATGVAVAVTATAWSLFAASGWPGAPRLEVAEAAGRGDRAFGQPVHGVQVAASRRVWRLILTAHPDGIGVGGVGCPGCDGSITSADRMLAARQPLRDVKFLVADGADNASVFYTGTLTSAGSSTTSRAFVVLTEPPPFTVFVDAVPTESYVLCPNSRQILQVGQADFDRYSGTHAGRGRNFGYEWRYVPICPGLLGDVICSIHCWLDPIGGGTCEQLKECG